jgi:diguanylate cyclase (GGDEF)-like protein
MNKFFIKHTPVILLVNVLILHIVGYLIEVNLNSRFALLVWLIIGVIDTTFAFSCGKLIQTLYQDAYRDSLTDLNNRNFFHLKLESELKKVQKDKTFISLIMIDIDDFKPINDTYGHIAGDTILKQLADILRKNIRANDSIVRWGGEEFCIILPNTCIEDSVKIAERIRELVKNNNFCYDIACVKATISVGVASTKEKIDINAFVELADKAMYKAKEKKNNVVSFEDLLVYENC